jgi:hypothetical protein
VIRPVRRGLLIADPECPAFDFEAGSSLDQLQAASVNYRIAIGPHAGRGHQRYHPARVVFQAAVVV